MLTPLTSRKLTALGTGLLAALIWALAGPGDRPAAAQDEGKGGDPWKEHAYQESSECKQCHTIPTEDRREKGSLDFILLTEYAIWKTHDKHAQAYAVLEGARGK